MIVKQNNDDADIIIVGAGIIGATFAALLGRSGWRVALVESTAAGADTWKVTDDPRVLAITRASEKIFRRINIWDRIGTEQIGYFRRMHVWDENGLGQIHFDSASLCQPTLGYIIAGGVIQTALHTALSNMDTIKWYRPVQSVLLEKHDDAVVLGLDDGRRLRSRLVVAADGANSTIRELAGINLESHDYRQSALVCVVQTERPHENIARQRFLAHGPLAFLPMSGPTRCGIVWSTDPEHAVTLMEMDTNSFNRELETAFASELGGIVDSGTRVTFPLRRAQAAQYCQSRLALIGDSAHNVHPLAGQGLNLGLLDAATLAEIIIEARSRGRDPGMYSILRRYERWRKGENYRMMMVFEGFKNLFENQSEPVRWARNIGMDIMDQTPLLKEWIMSHAMGVAGDVPAIVREHP